MQLSSDKEQERKNTGREEGEEVRMCVYTSLGNQDTFSETEILNL